ncbi:MAG: DUF2851 family protein [Paludibacteraceae bacterium]|nr:DUF2851 family protein [Paludibacteraceae bacterium]
MNEKFLHYIWQNKLFEAHSLQTIDGKKVDVIDVGRLNTDAGPDFFNAKLKIDDTLWAGNVEIHRNASDWIKHKHHTDKVYDSVILHVVQHDDAPIYRLNGELIPQIMLHYPTEIEQRYESLLANQKWIACEEKLKQVDSLFIDSWLTACLTERLSQKTEVIFNLLVQNKNNWEEAFYITLARNFGFGTNSDTFERLAKLLPLSYLGKHKDNLFQIEALLFGQSGLLFSSKKEPDEYQLSLEKEYRFLQAKFELKPIDGSLWKMLRLRPTNFPHVRLAQFASLIHNSSKLFSKIIENPEFELIEPLFECNPSEYWTTHYLFGEESTPRGKKLGKSAIHVILINTVVPFIFCYGKSKQNEELQETALNLLEKIPAERNSVIAGWQVAGITASSAFDSQSLLQLKKCYCDEKKCLQCRIGHKVLSRKNQ